MFRYDWKWPSKTNLNIIGANWSVPDQPGWHGYGQSLILSRSGQTLAKAKTDFGNEIVYADLPVPKRGDSDKDVSAINENPAGKSD